MKLILKLQVEIQRSYLVFQSWRNWRNVQFHLNDNVAYLIYVQKRCAVLFFVFLQVEVKGIYFLLFQGRIVQVCLQEIYWWWKMRRIQMVERYRHVEHFCGENLNVHYLFVIVLYIKMRVWHYEMFKYRKIVLIWIRHGQFFFLICFKNCSFQ